ncbi:MAG: hypothetical protein ACI95X_000001, partial [Paraglaciecola sp.]
KIKRIYNGCLFKKEKMKPMLNSLLWSSCLYIKISEWPQWWQRSHSTSVIRLENTATCWVIFNTVFVFLSWC